METISEEGKAYIEAKLCDVCKHCFYTGFPGDVACEITGKFTDYFDTCENGSLMISIGR